MTKNNEFDQVVIENVTNAGKDRDFIGLSNIWIRQAIQYNYAQNFTWLGRPIIQIPQDIYAIQQLIWDVKPDLIIETGIAHGGSLILSASMLALIDYCQAVESRKVLDPLQSKRKVIGIDIDIRKHNRDAIENHPLAHFIKMIEGSSIDSTIIDQVRNEAANYDKIMVFLDSNHTHSHVLSELELYAPMTSLGSYCVVWDTGVEGLPESYCSDRPWGPGDNPKTAVWEYLQYLGNEERKDDAGNIIKFEINKFIENKIMITASPDGFLKRIL